MSSASALLSSSREFKWNLVHVNPNSTLPTNRNIVRTNICNMNCCHVTISTVAPRSNGGNLCYAFDQWILGMQLRWADERVAPWYWVGNLSIIACDNGGHIDRVEWRWLSLFFLILLFCSQKADAFSQWRNHWKNIGHHPRCDDDRPDNWRREVEKPNPHGLMTHTRTIPKPMYVTHVHVHELDTYAPRT